MARIRLYTIYDRVAEDSSAPFAAVNDGVAMRQLKSLIREVPPADREEYRLYYLCDYDTSSMGVVMASDMMPAEVFGVDDVQDSVRDIHAPMISGGNHGHI